MKAEDGFPGRVKFVDRTGAVATGEPRGESYMIARWLFSIDLAILILRAAPRAPVRIRVQPWVDLLDGAAEYDREFTSQIDLDRAGPAIIAAWCDDGTEYCHLIDGWHRLRKARDLGRETLPAVLLTSEETARVMTDLRRHDGPLHEAAARLARELVKIERAKLYLSAGFASAEAYAAKRLGLTPEAVSLFLTHGQCASRFDRVPRTRSGAPFFFDQAVSRFAGLDLAGLTLR